MSIIPFVPNTSFTTDIVEKLEKKLTGMVKAGAEEAKREAEESIKSIIPKHAPIFILVKTECRHSIGACKIVSDIQKLSNNPVVVFNTDVSYNTFVRLDNFKESIPEQLGFANELLHNDFISNIMTHKGNIHCVPQVFVYMNNEWKYYGGESSMKKYLEEHPAPSLPNTNSQTTPRAYAKCTLKW